MCAIYVTETDAEPQMLYVLTDHLGSIQIITDENGNKLDEYSYDAWGRQRDPINMAPVQTPTRGLLDLGFSGHEFIALANLVNMEGRIYDPVIGRFLSPDPYLTLPEYTQGLNRYSYVLNNPLSLTDPSGYSAVGVWLKYNWKPITSTVVAVGVTIVFPGAGIIVPAAVGSFAGGFTYAMLTTGNLGDAFLLGLSKVPVATFSAVGSFMIGEVFATGNNLVFGKLLLKPLLHGAFQGGLSYGNGSSFASGFYAGMFSSISGGLTSNTETTFGRIIIGAVAGGVGAEIGGGKFANGAVTGAFVMMFNELRHHPTPQQIAAAILRNRIFIPGTFYLNPFYNAEAILIDFGFESVGAEKDWGMAFILVGKDAGQTVFFDEFAKGGSIEISAGAEIGRADFSGNPNAFTKEMILGARIKGWIGWGPAGCGFARAQVGDYYIYSTTIMIGLSAAPIYNFSAGFNEGNIRPITQ